MTKIPFEDYGGSGQALHFAHANAYPPSCYRQLLQSLAINYRVTAIHFRPLWTGSWQEAFAHFRQKSVFARLTDEALWDYVKLGLTNDNGNLHLTYRPAWEAHIYALQVNDMWDAIPKISQPTLALRGAESDTLLPEAWELWQQKQPEAVFTEVEGAGHLLPLEKPAVVVEVIDPFIEDLKPNGVESR